jgi:poly(3-hydroxybutyrate) depolymerase
MTLHRRLLGALIVVAAALVAAEAAHAAPPEIDCTTTGGAYAVGTNCRQIEVDGELRRFVAYVPATQPTTGPRAPLVFMFHGSSGTGEQFLRISGWRQQADATGLIAVFPTGLRYRILENGRLSTKWNDGTLETKIDTSERPPADDVGFVDAMLAELGAHLPIDRQRIYASGFSSGADFTAHLAVERSTTLAAVGFSAGGLHEPGAPARQIPMAMSVGTRDDRILAQTGLDELPLDPVEILTQPVLDAQIEIQLATLRLDPAHYRAVALPRMTGLSWPAANPVFTFTMLRGVGHHYPNGGNKSAGFRAAPAFWDFFLANPLERAR